jgi:hypothetical protein
MQGLNTLRLRGFSLLHHVIQVSEIYCLERETHYNHFASYLCDRLTTACLITTVFQACVQQLFWPNSGDEHGKNQRPLATFPSAFFVGTQRWHSVNGCRTGGNEAHHSAKNFSDRTAPRGRGIHRVSAHQ